MIQLVEYARRETQRAHLIVPEGECDGGGVGEVDGCEMNGKQAKGAMLGFGIFACCKILDNHFE